MKRPRVLPLSDRSSAALKPPSGTLRGNGLDGWFGGMSTRAVALLILLAVLPLPAANFGTSAARADDGDAVREKLIGTFRTRPAAPPPPRAEPGEERPEFLTGALASTQSPEDTFRRDAGDRIFFTSGSTQFSARALDVIAAQAEWLRRRPQLKLTIEGHADDGGATDEDMRLSAERAEAVRNRLVMGGVEPRRIVLLARGREQRVAPCPGSVCAAQNRRAVIVVHAAGAGDRIGLERSLPAVPRRGDPGPGRSVPSTR